MGLQQAEFAQKIQIGLKTLRKIEQGDLNVSFEKLNYILNCLGLGMRPAELVSAPAQRKEIVHTKESILKMLRSIFQIFRIKYQMTELSLFGSYAKGTSSNESDIDLLVDFAKAPNLEVEGEIQLILENLFKGTKVDLTHRKNIHENYRNEIEETKISVG